MSSFHLNQLTKKVDAICLIFVHSGEYHIDDIKVYSRPYSRIEQTLNSFYEHADIENISYEYEGNHLNISATSDSDRYLYIAIPYSEGWHAKVDEEPVDIIRTNIAFIAIPLSEGTHNIEMTYRTPYLYLGWTISAFGIILFAGYIIFENKKKSKCAELNLPE